MRTEQKVTKVTGKTVAKAAGKTILVLVIVIGILILDVLAIRGVYFGIMYVGDRIADLGVYLAQIGTSDKEETETEKKLTKEDIRKIREEEDKRLQEIFAADYPPKEIPEDK